VDRRSPDHHKSQNHAEFRQSGNHTGCRCERCTHFSQEIISETGGLFNWMQTQTPQDIENYLQATTDEFTKLYPNHAENFNQILNEEPFEQSSLAEVQSREKKLRGRFMKVATGNNTSDISDEQFNDKLDSVLNSFKQMFHKEDPDEPSPEGPQQAPPTDGPQQTPPTDGPQQAPEGSPPKPSRKSKLLLQFKEKFDAAKKSMEVWASENKTKWETMREDLKKSYDEHEERVQALAGATTADAKESARSALEQSRQKFEGQSKKAAEFLAKARDTSREKADVAKQDLEEKKKAALAAVGELKDGSVREAKTRAIVAAFGTDMGKLKKETDRLSEYYENQKKQLGEKCKNIPTTNGMSCTIL
jgi:hypothetical protein